MPDRPPIGIASMALVGFCLAASSARTEDGPPLTSAARSAAMRKLARAITLAPAPAGTKSELISEPIYRFDDPARLFSDGTVWAFGKSGRPDALLCLSLEKNDRGQLKWIHELTSLSGGPIAAISRHGSGPWAWNPKEPGIVLQPILRAQTPADEAGKRLRQMRETARRLQGVRVAGPGTQRPFRPVRTAPPSPARPPLSRSESRVGGRRDLPDGLRTQPRDRAADRGASRGQGRAGLVLRVGADWSGQVSREPRRPRSRRPPQAGRRGMEESVLSVRPASTGPAGLIERPYPGVT